MPFTLTPDNETAFAAYTSHRDAVRAAIAHGVYPNVNAALSRWRDLNAFLAAADPALAAYHAELLGPAAAYTGQIEAALSDLLTLLRAAETARPGVFVLAAE